MQIDIPSDIRALNSLSQSAAPTRDPEEELGRTAFLELMIAQVSNQDPLEPAKNEAFIAQLAQFSSVEGIQNLNESMDTLVASLRSGMAMGAAGLVGRNVLIQTSQTALNTSGGLGGTIEVDSASPNLVVDIFNSQGQVVKRLEMGAVERGEVRFNWDGLSEAGEQLPQDYYRVQAYTAIDGTRRDFAVNLPDQITSVSLTDQGLVANLAGGSSVPAIQIKEIQ
ncbi:MAG: flagellar hook assembly protein FlgD [Pseudomonadota bacterium]